jgi:hypothetical protein
MEENTARADHLQNEKKIKVSGRIYESNGIYQMGFNWMEPERSSLRSRRSRIETVSCAGSLITKPIRTTFIPTL